MKISKRNLLIGSAAMMLSDVARGTERKRMLITGHLGNIGSRLAPYYQGAWNVSGIDKKEGREFDLSILNDDWVSRLAGIDTIIHLAALADPNGPTEDIYRNNVSTTALVVDQAIRANVRRVVFASSTWACPSQYGNPANSYSPVNPYGAAKLFGEALLQNAVRDDRLTASIVRVGWAPKEGADVSNAAPWLKAILWGNRELKAGFDQGIYSHERFIRIDAIRA